MDRLLHGTEFRPTVIASSNSCLVGDQNDRNRNRIGGRNHGHRARADCDVLDAMQIVHLLDNHSVAIEEQCRATSVAARGHLTPHTVRTERISDRTPRRQYQGPPYIMPLPQRAPSCPFSFIYPSFTWIKQPLHASNKQRSAKACSVHFDPDLRDEHGL